MNAVVGPAEGARETGSADPSQVEAASWFFENAHDLFGVVGADGRLVSVNPAWERVTGWTNAELVGRRLLDIMHDACRDEVIAMARAVAAHGSTVTRMQLVKRDGGSVWLEGTAALGPNGEIMGTLRDVTAERRRADELDRLRQVQSRLQETAGVGLWRFDPETQQLDWSDEWLAMFAEAGVKMDTVEDFMAVCHPADVEGVVAAMERVTQEGVMAAFNHRYQAANGRWIWIRANVWAERGADGRQIVHGISQVTTELAEALEAVTEARRSAEAQAHRLKIALGAAKAAVLEVDPATQRVWCSPEFVALVGREMTFEEALSPVWPFIHTDDVARVLAAVADRRPGERAEPIDARIVLANGAPLWARFFLEVEADATGAPSRAVVLVMDIDAAKRQELALIEAEHAAQMAAEAKSQFLANMSHEIRTPMNGVLGVLHLLKSQGLPGPARAMIDEALACGGMLQALLDDVVDFSKIEAGRLELSPEAADPTVILEGVVKMLRPKAEDKGLAFRLDAPDLPAWVMTDPVRLRQCLFNLIGNAVKFTPAGSVSVRVRRKESPTGLRLRFEVEDTGIGIDEAAQAKLFRRFQQADATTTRRFGGSGLGLAITRELVTMMAGEVGVVSAAGKGSIFWFEIAAPEVEAPAAAIEADGGPLEGLCVLVVEDNATNRMIVTKMLEGLGASVETAEDGERGVEAALCGGFDLILMDIQMPGIDGIEATRQIRRSGTSAALIPIIALTANVLTHQRESYLAAGMDGVVGKPVSPGALLSEIARVAAQDASEDPVQLTG
jgi:PAS domain S-box-containing protein